MSTKAERIARWRRERTPEQARAAQRRYAARNPEKIRARNAVGNAVVRGELERGECEVGIGCEGRIEAHHDDYSKPLEVRWLCERHHRRLARGRAA